MLTTMIDGRRRMWLIASGAVVFLAIAALVLVLTGVIGDTNNDKGGVSPSGSPTPTVTEAPPEEEPTTPSTEDPPNPNPTIEESSILSDALYPAPKVEGYSPADVEAAVETALAFAESGIMNSFFLTGEWLDAPQEEIGGQFANSASPQLVEVINGLDIENPQESRALASIAAILRNPNDFQVHQKCAEGHWNTCLSRPVNIDHLAITEDSNSEDPKETQLVISFDVTTSRLLYFQQEEAHSDMLYLYTLWLKKNPNGDWKVEAYQNKYTFGEVTTGKPQGEIKVEEHDHYDNT